jgi:inorganic pyrophosphatase
MKILKNLSLSRIKEEKFITLIEIPKGSKKKYEIDKETGFLILDRFLSTSFHYPFNYGFIPFTLCEDKDPLDVLVLSQDVIDPMILVECRPIGIIQMIDNNEMDEKIIAVPINDLLMDSFQDINDISSSLLSEIKHFFMHYKDLEKNKNVIIEKIENKNKAMQTIKKALIKYKENNKK